MAYEGYVDFVDDTTIGGWVYDNAHANEAVTVEVLAGDRVLATIPADRPRPDLLAHGKGNGRHAFHYQLDRPSIGPLAVRLPGRRWCLPRSGSAPVSGRFQAQLDHSLEFGFPNGDAVFTVAARSPDELPIAGRLIEAFHRAFNDAPDAHGRMADVWSTLTDECHQEIAHLLRRRHVQGVAAYLREAHAKGITHGITQGHVTTPLLRARADARQLEHARFSDQLASLAEALGVLDVESPEQHGRWAENLHTDPDALIARIGQAAGVPVVPPPVIGSLMGLPTATGVLSGRDMLALYASLRIRTVTPAARPVVCEIGGGLGGVAYYLARAGAVSRHTIIDLPLVNVLQGYYLLRALPDVPIRLYGEPPNPSAIIEVLPTFAFDRDDGPVDLLFNMDSMPEMNAEYGLAYLRRARQRPARRFLSINQEARAPQNGEARQTVVRELATQVGGFHSQYRFRHWLRAGYVEELFDVDPA